MSAGPAPATSRENPAIRGALVGLALSVLLPSLATSSANVGLPTVAEAFEASFQDVQWIVLAYLLVITSLVVGAGRLGDIVGHRRLLLASIAVFTLASLLCGLAPTLELLIAARALQGVGAAGMVALTMAFVAKTVPTARTGSAMGLLGTMSAVGTALGPTLGGVLVAGFGWPAIFGVNVPLGLLTLLLCHRFLPVDRRHATPGPAAFDYLGTLLLALTLGAYALAVTIEHGAVGPLGLGLLFAAGVGLTLFVGVEARTAAPLVRLTMFTDPVLGAGLVTNALVSTVLMTTLVVGPFHLARVLDLDPAAVGLVMSTGPLVAALISAAAGRAVDRRGAAPMAVVGLLGVLSGCVGLASIPVQWGVPGYVAPLVVITAGYALFQTANNTGVMSGVGPDDRGLVSGMVNLSRNLGLITGASVMGAVFAVASGTGDGTTALPLDIATGTRCTFAVAAALIAVGLAVAVRSRARARRPSAAADCSSG